MEIKFKKLIPEAKEPLKTIEIDAGFDLFATTKEETENYIEYGTGIAIEIPIGYVGLVFPRSSISNKDVMLKNSVGIIDASYRGEIRCRFYDTKKNKDYLEIIQNGVINKIFNPHNIRKIYEIGDRVAQIVFLELPKITLIETNELSDTQRGIGGFGSTGN